MVVQVPTVRTLLDVAVLGEVLHPNPHVDHRLPAVLTVQTGLRGDTDTSATVPLPLPHYTVPVTQTAMQHSHV